MTTTYSQLSSSVDSKQSLVGYQLEGKLAGVKGIDTDRLKEAMRLAKADQSYLARAAGCTPGAINQIVAGNVSRSRFLPDIADALGVSLRWLRGEDVPRDPVAPIQPPSEPQTQLLMMPVALPSESALAQMFEGLLETLDRSAPVDELARELAQLLPTGLAQLRGRLTEAPRLPTPAPARAEAAEALATADHEPRR